MLESKLEERGLGLVAPHCTIEDSHTKKTPSVAIMDLIARSKLFASASFGRAQVVYVSIHHGEGVLQLSWSASETA